MFFPLLIFEKILCRDARQMRNFYQSFWYRLCKSIKINMDKVSCNKVIFKLYLLYTFILLEYSVYLINKQKLYFFSKTYFFNLLQQ